MGTNFLSGHGQSRNGHGLKPETTFARLWGAKAPEQIAVAIRQLVTEAITTEGQMSDVHTASKWSAIGSEQASPGQRPGFDGHNVPSPEGHKKSQTPNKTPLGLMDTTSQALKGRGKGGGTPSWLVAMGFPLTPEGRSCPRAA